MPASTMRRTCAASSSYTRISRRGQRRQQLRHRRAATALPRHQRAPADQHQVAADIERRRLARQPHRVLEGLAVGHQRGRGQNAVAVRFHDARVHVRREAEIVRVHHQLFARRSKQRQPDGQELLGIGAHVLGQRLELARRAVQRLVKLRVHHQLPQRALAGIDLVDGGVELGHQFVQLLVELRRPSAACRPCPCRR